MAKTIGDTLTYVETLEPVKTLADTLVDVKAQLVDDTLKEMEAEAVVHTQAERLDKMRH